jgi:CubicO group peptidase (beta-lactamase class C family)
VQGRRPAPNGPVSCALPAVLGQNQSVRSTDQQSSWWAQVTEHLAGVAIAAGASSPEIGRTLWCTGHLDGPAVTPSTTFYTGSITKQLTAALVARAVLDGHLSTQVSIRSYLPELPSWTSAVHLRHLLHHTAALPQPRELAVALGYTDDAAGWAQMDNQEVLTGLHLVAPSAPAGQRFSYDNTGYILLVEALEAVHGRDVTDLARTYLLSPLKLERSHLGGTAPLSLPGHSDPPATIGDGGLWTCSADLLAWLDAMNAGTLGADLSALLQTPGQLDDGTALDYAWGVVRRPAPAGPLYMHGGEWPGWCAMTVRCPTTQTAAAVLAATEDMVAVHDAALRLHQVSSHVS